MSRRIGFRYMHSVGYGYPKLHPLACWYNSCENLGTWSINAQIAAAITITDKKEGSGSLKLIRDESASGDLYAYPTGFVRCANYFGFWAKYQPTLTGLGLVMISKERTSDNHWHKLRLRYRDAPYNDYVIDHGAYDGDTATWSGIIGSFDPNTWYWYEMYNSNGNLYLRQNGVILGSIAKDGVALDDTWNIARLIVPDVYKLGTIWLDYWRLASLYEYPPT